MLDIILNTLLAGAAGLLVHFGQAWFGRYVNLLAKQRAYARIRAESWYCRGAHIIRAVDPASGAVICENYHIDELSVGRVLLRSRDGSAVIPMTCMEFESLHVTINSTDTNGD